MVSFSKLMACSFKTRMANSPAPFVSLAEIRLKWTSSPSDARCACPLSLAYGSFQAPLNSLVGSDGSDFGV